MHNDRLPLVFGVVVSTVLASTLVIAGLKAGITPGVSPLVILCAWGAFARYATSSGGSRFLNISQVAGSAGMAVTSGVIFTAPLVQHFFRARGEEIPPVDFVTYTIMSLAGALIGYGFVGLATKKFLTDPTLPAPEARACEAMIDAAVVEASERPKLSTSLFAGLGLSFLAPLVTRSGLSSGSVHLYGKEQGGRSFELAVPFDPILIGIGGLLTIATALLVFAGSALRALGDWLLAGISAGSELAANYPANSMRWVGGGAMTVAVAYSLTKFMAVRRTEAQEDSGDAAILEVDDGVKRGLMAATALGFAILVGWLFWQDGVNGFSISMAVVIFALAMVMVPLGAILSLQIGSSASPVSGTIFVTTLVLCLVALAAGRTEIADIHVITPLLVGACVAVCTANDSSQDYKTMQFCRVRVQDGFKAQLFGLIAACFAVPYTLYVAHAAFGIGDELPAPQGEMFATLVDGLLFQQELPWGPIVIGLTIGAAAVAMDVAGARKGIQLPSMALAVGIYLPAELGIGILVGALFRWFAERGSKTPRHESILTAAGFITGAAALELILGILVLAANLNPDEDLLLFGSLGEGATDWIPGAMAGIGILALGALLFVNSKPKR